MRKFVSRLLVGLAVLLAASACAATRHTSTSNEVPTSVSSTTQLPEPSTTTTADAQQPARTEPFSIAIGPEGVTYQRDGDPPSGPSSFVVLEDGSVVVADTMAADRGEPRLLRYDRHGVLLSVIDLATFEVAAIVDVEKANGTLVVLDVHTDRAIYRVLSIELDGGLRSSTVIPDGSHFENGLTGLASDDSGVLLEFEFGRRYERLASDGSSTEQATLVLGGHEVEVTSEASKVATVRVGDAQWDVTRRTDLGGVTLVGVASDTIVLVVDEVDTSGAALSVTRRVQRYTLSGELIGEVEFDAGDQEVDIARPLEVGALGDILRMWARPDRVDIVVLAL